MKINAPDKIYIDGCSSFACETTDDSIEYIRKDAFIEKACFYIKDMVLDITYSDVDGKENYNIDEFIEDFKNYMKGE